MIKTASPYLYTKREETKHYDGVFEYDNREGEINALLQKRASVLKDYLEDIANNSQSMSSNRLRQQKTLTGLDNNLESVLDEISQNIYSDYLSKGIHNQNIVSRKNEQLNNIIEKATIESEKIKKIQKDIHALSGEKNESGLAIKAYNVQYMVFIILTLIIVITTIISVFKSGVTRAEIGILVVFLASLIYRFYNYLKENVGIWLNEIAVSIKKLFS
jgi:hypothetical protein